MTGEGTDRQVLSPLPELLMYHLDPADGADLARHLNETISPAWSRRGPIASTASASAPMQDVERAIAALRAIRDLGLQGVEIRSNVEGPEPGGGAASDRSSARRRGAGIGRVRPRQPADRGPTGSHTSRPSSPTRPLGFPIESGLAGASLIWSGMLDELPDLRVCISHGGGVLMQLLARSDQNWHAREAVRRLLPRAPLEYAAMLYYDDLAFGTAPLRYLIDHVGAGQVMIGSDWQGTGPKEPAPAEEFAALGLAAEERERIGWKNALRYLDEG